LGLYRVEGFTRKTTFTLPASLANVLGILWMVVSVLFLVAAVAVLLHRDWWKPVT